MKTKNTTGFLTTLLLNSSFCIGVAAQSQTPPAPPAAPAPSPHKAASTRKAKVHVRVPRVVVENPVAAPQVVTILHRLTGLKVVKQLLRWEQLAAIAKLDENFKIDEEVHTNVIAGLALDDGRTIAAWLPEVGAEMPLPAIPRHFSAPPQPKQPTKPATDPGEPKATTTVLVPMAPLGYSGFPPQPADLRIITRDGRRVGGHYVGLDGLTGLSVITLDRASGTKTSDSDEVAISVGQHIQLIGPEPAAHNEASTGTATYVRIAEREAVVVTVKRSPSGHLARVKVKSSRLSPVNIGSIAVNDGGKTLGIVDAVIGNEATIVPIALVRSAAKRVIERQASVPRPWLGIRGEPVDSLSFERILRYGWRVDRARLLAESGRGIFLTAVVPGSPAARATLKAGDIILDVNDGPVKSAEDFTWVLQEAGPGGSVAFKVARPGNPADEAMQIELGESPDPFFGLRRLEGKTRFVAPGSLKAYGVEGIPIRERVATQLGAARGFLVVYVQPGTAGFTAGLRPGDVIESIDGQQVISGYAPMVIAAPAGGSCTVNVVRNKGKLVLTIETVTKKTSE